MQRKLTIDIDESIYEGLRRVVGENDISQFIENLVRPYVLEADLESAYRLMAADEEREADALEWSESLIGDIPTEDSFDDNSIKATNWE